MASEQFLVQVQDYVSDEVEWVVEELDSEESHRYAISKEGELFSNAGRDVVSLDPLVHVQFPIRLSLTNK